MVVCSEYQITSIHLSGRYLLNAAEELGKSIYTFIWQISPRFGGVNTDFYSNEIITLIIMILQGLEVSSFPNYQLFDFMRAMS